MGPLLIARRGSFRRSLALLRGLRIGWAALAQSVRLIHLEEVMRMVGFGHPELATHPMGGSGSAPRGSRESQDALYRGRLI